jgi:hypothetical protein
MAEILSQKEIDALLSQIEPESMNRRATNETQRVGAAVEATKVIRVPKRVIPRSYNPYRSPVVKAGFIVMNPEGEVESGPQRIVVRSLSNYAQLQKRRFKATNRSAR